MSKRHYTLVVATVALFSGARSFASDVVLIHGHIYTGNEKMPWAQALAVTGSKIDAVGTDQEISSRREAKTKVIDLQGSTVIPGISDAHTHMWFGGLALRGFNFATPELRITANEPDKLVAQLKAYAASHPKDKVLFGRGQFSVAADSPATHQLLDRAVPDRPLVIHGTGEHNLWVNGKALAMAGITDKPVADPLEERYVVRDAQHHPTGVLIDPAMQLIVRALPAEPLEDRMAVLREAAHFLNSYGITSVVNATGNLKEIEVYGALRDRGQLTVRTRTSFAEVSVNHHLTPQFLAGLEKARTTYHDDWVSANLVKFFSDGAGATSAQLQPNADGTQARPWYEPADYQKTVLELDKRGYQIMTHSIGDAAARMVLDAYEQVEKINGPRDRRFRMEHLFSLTPQDIPRFFKLSVIADMQPSFCCSSNAPNRNHRWQTLEKTGATLAFSSDWPCTWPPDPYIGIQEAVTRQSRPFGNSARSVDPEYFMPEEAVTVEQAVNAYTRAAAYARFSEDKLGTLEPGKEADLAVLSQDIFTVAHEDIGKTKAMLTMAGGKVVFERPKL
jgi:predicted amidohydrolase YtcJ